MKGKVPIVFGYLCSVISNARIAQSTVGCTMASCACLPQLSVIDYFRLSESHSKANPLRRIPRGRTEEVVDSCGALTQPRIWVEKCCSVFKQDDNFTSFLTRHSSISGSF